MPGSDYWKKRFELLEDTINNKGAQYMKDSEAIYRKAISNTEKEISRWYTRFADNEGISYQRAVEMLTGDELKEFHMDVKEYIQKGKTLGVSDQWSKELERASTKVHISKLEALKLQMQQQVEELTGKKAKGITDLMSDIYSDTFYKTAFEIQKGFGVATNFAKLDKKVVDKILVKPWASDGSNFSERIWGSHRAQLVNKLHEGLTINLIQGKPPDNLIKEIANTFEVDRKRAATLVFTEKAYFQSIAQRDSFKNLGIEEYEIVATLDTKTSEICREMDGRHFKLSDYQIGLTAPPFHPRCRTATAPFFDDEFEDEVKRAARDENGDYYTVPANMKYDEWYRGFVEGDKNTLDKLKPTKSAKKVESIRTFDGIIKIPSRSYDDIIEYIANIDDTSFNSNVKIKIGDEDNILKDIMDEVGASGLPKSISEDEFNVLIEKGQQALYRGVTDEKFVKEFLEGNVFVGLGVNGSGIYTSSSRKYALRYANEIDDNVMKMLIDDKAKIIPIDKLYKDKKSFIKYIESKFSGKEKDKIFKIIANNGKFAILNGYDVIDFGMHKLVLNRTVLKVVRYDGKN
jgi:SPP1 gp7 family putative phage head morphogenesis protein